MWKITGNLLFILLESRSVHLMLKHWNLTSSLTLHRASLGAGVCHTLCTLHFSGGVLVRSASGLASRVVHHATIIDQPPAHSTF